MKVLIVSTSERTGGAAIAARRLAEALNATGTADARMLVRDRSSREPWVAEVAASSLRRKGAFVCERGLIWLANGMSRDGLWGVDIASCGCGDITATEEFRSADVVHLHWTSQGMLSLGELERIVQSGKPLVITLHDQWYFTGICHYSDGCAKYESRCGKCPQLRGHVVDVARRVFMRKCRIMADARRPVTFVGCSGWMADLARKSPVTAGHRVVNIANALDTDLYAPSPDRMQLRRELGLGGEAPLLLFGAHKLTDPRKGFGYMAAAARILAERGVCKPEVVLVGAMGAEAARELALPAHAVGYVGDEREMARLYAASDLYVTPSLQDNLPNTVAEAMSCGTPCVGFDTGGIPEMIHHKVDGYVARTADASDLANGIEWCIGQSVMRHAARQSAVEAYSRRKVAEAMSRCYAEAMAHQDI